MTPGGRAGKKPVRIDVSVEGNRVRLAIDEKVYPLDAIYGAAYLFVDRCFVFLSRTPSGKVSVRLTSRGPAEEGEPEAMAGEFGNELLNQTLRLRLSESTARIRESYTAAALRAANAGPSIDDLLAQLEAEELNEDPLQIMVPWEQKYGKPGGEPAPAGSGVDGNGDKKDG